MFVLIVALIDASMTNLRRFIKMKQAQNAEAKEFARKQRELEDPKNVKLRTTSYQRKHHKPPISF